MHCFLSMKDRTQLQDNASNILSRLTTEYVSPILFMDFRDLFSDLFVSSSNTKGYDGAESECETSRSLCRMCLHPVIKRFSFVWVKKLFILMNSFIKIRSSTD